MDFGFTEEQDALRDLAEQIFAGGAHVDRLKEIEKSDERVDRVLWQKLAESNLLGVAIAEAHGGIGFGMVELALVAEQQGRHVAPVPLAATLARAALPIAHFGSEAMRAAWLPRIVEGSAILTGAYAERGANAATRRSSVRAVRRGDAWELSGAKIAVPAMNVSDAVIVPAQHEDGTLSVFVVDARATGITSVDAITTNREKHATVTFDAVVVDDAAVLGSIGQGVEVLEWTLLRLSVVHCAIALGACETALAMAAAYTSQRQQFGRPLSTNQGVALRAADAYIDIDALRVTLWQAAWRIDAGLGAGLEVEVAQYWASEGGQRVVHATQHLHGGMGADVDYPVHRTFLWVKQFENLLGGGSQQLARLGARIAADAKAAVATA